MTINSMVQNGAKNTTTVQPVLVRLNTLFDARGEAVLPSRRGIHFGLCRQIMHFFARSTSEGCLAEPWMEWQQKVIFVEFLLNSKPQGDDV